MNSEAALRAFLAAENTLALATISDSGEPVATPLFYICGEDLTLYWLSSPDSRHSRNLSARPRASATVFAHVSHWEDIRGAQMEGHAGAAGIEAREAMLDKYRRRFELGPGLEGAIARSTLYVFRPEWVRYMDNSLGFGFREELRLGPA
jgi:uncharacterized protein